MLSQENEWKHIWTGLYKYEGGVEVEYTVREDAVEGYTAEYDSIMSNDGTHIDATVTNSHEVLTQEITITKKWVDNNNAQGHRPDLVTIQLYKNGEAYGDAIEVTAADGWTHSMDVPVYENGEKIVWTVEELNVPFKYMVSYDQTTLTVTNTLSVGGVPITGDSSDLLGLLGLFFASVVGILFCCILKKKRKCEQ